MSVHQRVIKKNFNRILKIKSVVSFEKDLHVSYMSIQVPGGGGVTSKIQTYFFTVPSPRNRRTTFALSERVVTLGNTCL